MSKRPNDAEHPVRPRGGKSQRIDRQAVLPLNPDLYNEKLPYSLTRPRASVQTRIERVETKKIFDVKTSGMPVAEGCWIGKKLQNGEQPKQWTVRECRDSGFKKIKWDGIDPITLVDGEDRIMAMCAGRPIASEWDEVIVNVKEKMQECLVEGEANGAFKGLDTRRGDFHGIPAGLSFGGGQAEPRNLEQKPVGLDRIVNSLVNFEPVRRIAGFQSSAFAWYAPNVYRYYYDHLEELYNHPTGYNLEPVFGSRSIFPATTFNIGPYTATEAHRDFKNVPYGWCAITALGEFDYKRGGHLILFDINRYIEFPAGSTIFIPSCLYTHGNTPVKVTGNQTRRMSMTQYCAGGLLRWSHYNFQTVASLNTTVEGRAFRASRDRTTKSIQPRLAKLFSTQDSLPGDRVALFGHD